MIDLWAAALLLALVTASISFVCLFIRKYRRRAKWALACSVVCFFTGVAGVGITGNRMDREAQRLGYSGWRDQRAAEKRAKEDRRAEARAKEVTAAAEHDRAREAKRPPADPRPADQRINVAPVATTPPAKPAYCSGTGTYLLPECGWTEEKQRAAEAAAASASARDTVDEARQQRAFNCAVLRDAVDEANKAAANAERYGVHQTVSEAMEIDRAATTLQNCP